MASEAYSVIEPIKDRLYPKTFKYVHLVDGKERTVESPLFGDLIEAVELSVRLLLRAHEALSPPARGA